MSVKDLDTKAREKFDPYSDAGRDLYRGKNQDLEAPQASVDREFNDIANRFNDGQQTPDDFANMSNRLRDVEENGNRIIRDNTPVIHNDKPAKLRQLLTSKKLRGKSSLIAVLFLLFGGGGFLTIFFAPSLAIVQMKEIFTESLNDQLHAVDSRSATMLRAKMKTVTTGSCGVVKIKCNFAKMSDKQVKDFEKNNSGVKIEREDIANGKGKVSRITFDSKDNPEDITDPKQLQKRLSLNPEFQAAWTKGFNAKYMSAADKVALFVLGKNKASKAENISGNTDEERQKKLNDVAGGVEDSGAQHLTKTTDKDGKEIYVDDSGQPVDTAAASGAEAIGNEVANLEKNGGYKAIFTNTLARGVQADSALDNSCTAFNFVRRTSALAKIVKKSQAIRFALALVLTPADKIKAGDATEGDTNFSGNNLMTTQPTAQVLDDTKLNDPNTASKPPLVTDPEAGGNAFDSPGYQTAAYGAVPTLSSRAARFSLSAGSIAVVDKIISSVAKVVNGGDPNPKEVSKKCKYVQNTFVRIGALGAGILAGVGTFGIWTAAQIGGSFLVQAAMPAVAASLGDMLAGNAFKDLTGLDSGDATYVGTAGLMGDIAENRGMAPVTDAQQGAAYLAANKQANEEYDQTQEYLARSTPLDINNRYSFLGSMVFNLVPVVQSSRSSASVAMMNIASLIPKSFASLFQPVGAATLSTAYFNQCNDPTYKYAGIKAGPFCEVRHWMSPKQLAMDPLDNAQWMADSGNVDPESDTGEAKDNGQSWNYVKYLSECAHRTSGWGEDQDENSGDGTNCYKPEYQGLNDHFSVYTMDQSINAAMDGDGSSSSSSGAVNV